MEVMSRLNSDEDENNQSETSESDSHTFRQRTDNASSEDEDNDHASLLHNYTSPEEKGKCRKTISFDIQSSLTALNKED